MGRSNLCDTSSTDCLERDSRIKESAPGSSMKERRGCKLFQGLHRAARRKKRENVSYFKAQPLGNQMVINRKSVRGVKGEEEGRMGIAD